MELIGTVFQGSGKYGDFGWMIEQPEFNDSLFIFNDNEEQFLAHLNDPESSIGCSPGGGNAVIRPYQCQNPPRASGIPTGSKGIGYTQLTHDSAIIIDRSIEVIDSLLSTELYYQVFYSSIHENGPLGTGTFKVCDDIRAYILKQLRMLMYE
ncbi:MAG: hypothetical protein WCD18_19015 [Thermosynechococcaceae cyanobacterium]